MLKSSLLPAFRGIAEFFIEYMFVDEDGVYHTGPTCSPENSYQVQESNGVAVVQLAFSPAIDASVLRQVANAYALAIDMATTTHTQADRAQAGKEVSPKDLQEHTGIAGRFRGIVSRMPYGANPVVGVTTGYILEYPTPFPGALTDGPPAWALTNDTAAVNRKMFSFFKKHQKLKKEKSVLQSTAPQKAVREDGDPGHRHFSSLHWLYPGTFLPSDDTLSGMCGPLTMCIMPSCTRETCNMFE